MKGARVIRVSPPDPSPGAVEAAVETLQAGGIVLYPSDTVYGLLCRAGRVDTVARLSALKGYGPGRPFILLALSTEGASEIASMNDQALELAAEVWPGPVTMVLPAGRAAPGWVCAPDGTIAVRVPSDPLTRSLLATVDCPLVSTSANMKEQPAPSDFELIAPELLASIDLALDGGRLPESRPSRIVKPGPGGLEILR